MEILLLMTSLSRDASCPTSQIFIDTCRFVDREDGFDFSRIVSATNSNKHSSIIIIYIIISKDHTDYRRNSIVKSMLPLFCAT